MVIYSISRSPNSKLGEAFIIEKAISNQQGSKLQCNLKSLEITITVLLVCLCFLPAPDQHFPLQKIDAAHHFFRAAQQAVFYLSQG